MVMSTDWDVIVVGGGLAGLTAGATAARTGRRVLVLEAHQPGGRARTVERDGFVLNMGGHALYAGGPGMGVLRQLGIVPQGAPPPLARYRAVAGGRDHVLPTDVATLLRTGALSRRSKLQLAKLLALLPRLKPDRHAHASVHDWLAALHLRPDAEAMVRALIRLSTYTADVDTFSADAAIGQLQAAADGGVLYLHRGWAQLIESLSASLDVRTGVSVTGLDHADGVVEVHTGSGTLRTARAVVAAGGPAAVQRLLPVDPGWGDLGAPVTAACLDLGVQRIPDPGYVLSVDEPLYATTQGPPAHQAPDGQAVVALIRYGAREATRDRRDLERHAAAAGIGTEDIVTSRFLAHIAVTGAMPRAETGGLAGRPRFLDSGVPGVTVAGDWVGPTGLLSDASLASGHAAGLWAAQGSLRPSTAVG
jgi:phytoene dehydrogenase-like protein